MNRYSKYAFVFMASIAVLCAPHLVVGQNLAERLGYPADAKLLLLHADDLGVAHSVNEASVSALEAGRVSSASIMMTCPWVPEIAKYAAKHPEADLGLHLTLTSEWNYYKWGPVSGGEDAKTLRDDHGYLYPEVADVVTHASAEVVENEIRAQVKMALSLGIDPTHLDSHMGTLFQTPAYFAAYIKVGLEFGLPVFIPRDALAQQSPDIIAQLPEGLPLIDHFAMAPGNLTANKWESFYSGLIENMKPGVTEIIVHLAYDDEEMQAVTAEHPDYGAAWRQRDYDFVMSDHFAALLKEHDIKLVTYREIRDKLVRNK